ncbi:MAG: acetolactate decarboxylase [Flavobacteriaceae bacterium]|nr:acetolactate decarboxylase [Flavobacteriaceae bacterium]
MRILMNLLIVFLMVSCTHEGKHQVNVSYAGALKNMMSGDISKKIKIDTITNKTNLYALGAYQDLEGEIQIFNGVALNSKVINNQLMLNDSLNVAASLLVYANIPDWSESVSVSFASKSALESLIIDTAIKSGLDIEKPIPFLLEGDSFQIDWHVIDWDKDDTIHTHKKHQKSGLNGTVNNRNASVLGFYSNKHKAIFTHHSTTIHMHFKTEDNLLAGHVDGIAIKGNVTLKLPKK